MHPFRSSYIGRPVIFLWAIGWLLILPGDPAMAAVNFWVGKANTSGPVARPSGYQQATAPLILSQSDFDQLSPGQDLVRHDLGEFYFSVTPMSAQVVARQGIVAGALPASEPMAVFLGASNNRATRFSINFIEPVNSLGFVLMGHNSIRLTVEGTMTETVCHIPPLAAAGFRRWVGMEAGDEEIHRVFLEVEAGKEFGLDDLEKGVHIPEPGGPALALAGLLFFIWSGPRTNYRNGRRNT